MVSRFSTRSAFTRALTHRPCWAVTNSIRTKTANRRYRLPSSKHWSSKGLHYGHEHDARPLRPAPCGAVAVDHVGSPVNARRGNCPIAHRAADVPLAGDG